MIFKNGNPHLSVEKFSFTEFMAYVNCKSSYHHEQLDKHLFKKQVKNVAL